MPEITFIVPFVEYDRRSIGFTWSNVVGMCVCVFRRNTESILYKS